MGWSRTRGHVPSWPGHRAVQRSAGGPAAAGPAEPNLGPARADLREQEGEKETGRTAVETGGTPQRAGRVALAWRGRGNAENQKCQRRDSGIVESTSIAQLRGKTNQEY